MKPRTKLQRRIVAASGRLPEITPAQLHWGYAHLLPHEAFRTKKGKITCTECRHTWQGDQQIDRAVCPHCGVRLTVVTTRRRTSWNKTYLSVVTTREGLQVIRYFLLERRVRDGHPARYECCEVMQRWIAPDGKYATVARLRNTWYYDVWRCATPLALRKEYWLYNHMSVERSYPRRRLIPELRRTGLRYDLYAEDPVGIFRYTLSQRHAETLLKIGRHDLFRYFCRAGGRRIEDYWPSLRICLRNGYRIDDAASWCDYIDMLGRLGKDIHNAHYVCPSDFRQAHDRCHALLARIEAEEQAARRRAEYPNTRNSTGRPKASTSASLFRTERSKFGCCKAFRNLSRRARLCTTASSGITTRAIRSSSRPASRTGGWKRWRFRCRGCRSCSRAGRAIGIRSIMTASSAS